MKRYAKSREMYLFIAALLLCRAGGTAIYNLEHSPTLEEAKRVCPFSEKDPALHDRDKAARLYLEYLDENPDTVNKSAVLAHVGLLYLYAIDDDKEVYRDVEKAREYLRQAVEAAPDYICKNTILARTNLACMYPAGLERMRARIETYKWLMDLTDEQIRESARREAAYASVEIHDLDANTVERKPIYGDPEHMPEIDSAIEREAVRTRKFATTFAEETGVNLVYDALGSELPEAALAEAAKELEGYPVDALVREKLSELTARRAGALAEEASVEIGDVGSAGGSPEEAVVRKPMRPPKGGEQKPQPAPRVGPARRIWPWVYGVGLMCVGGAALWGLMRRYKRLGVPGSSTPHKQNIRRP